MMAIWVSFLRATTFNQSNPTAPPLNPEYALVTADLRHIEPLTHRRHTQVPPAHYILSVQDLSVSGFTTEDLEATLSGMYGDFTILTMAKSVYEAQRLGRGVLQRTMTSALIRTSGSIASTLKKVVGK